MGKYLSLGEINKSLLFILLMSVASVLYKYIFGFTYIECFYPMNIYRILYNWIIDENKKDCPRHRVFDTFFSYIGIVIISFFFVKDKTDNKTDERKSTAGQDNTSSRNLSVVLIYNRKKSYFRSWKARAYYIFILFLWVVEENSVLIYVDIFQDLDFWFFELIFVSFIYSRLFISKTPTHQKLGMLISIIVGSILKIKSISLSLNSDDVFYARKKVRILFVFVYFAIIIARSYVNTEIKTFLDLKYISQRLLLISYGIVGFITLLFTGLFTSSVACYGDLKESVCKFQYENDYYYDEVHVYCESGKNMLVRLIPIFLGIIAFFFEKYFSTLIIKFYTPVHVIFSFPIQYFLEKMFLLIFSALFFRDDLFTQENHVSKFLLDISGDTFSIIGFLIYLEIIELHFCNLDFDLKKNIMKRSENEIVDIEMIMSGEKPLLMSGNESDELSD